jgi:hypothetical protein
LRILAVRANASSSDFERDFTQGCVKYLIPSLRTEAHNPSGHRFADNGRHSGGEDGSFPGRMLCHLIFSW